MFNKTYHTTDNSIDFPDEITITHKHAPTTEQIKLLREMEKDLRNDVLGHVRIDDNEVKFNCFLRRMHFDDVELIATLMLNGKEIKVTHEFCKFSLHADNIREFFQKIANQIVQQVLISNYKRIEKLFQSLKNELI